MSTAYEVSAPLTAPPSPPSSAPRRIACDRCHGQKLKCPRDVNSTAPCTRCAKAGAICQVSPARATGRPAKNPKPQHRKSESAASINSSRPSLTDSVSSAEDELVNARSTFTPNVTQGISSSSAEYYPTSTVTCLPTTNDTKFYTTPEMQYNFMDLGDAAFPHPMSFEYDDGSNYMHFTQPIPNMVPAAFTMDSTPIMGFDCMNTQFGIMPPLPTPSLSNLDVGSTKSCSEERTLDGRSSPTNSQGHSYSPHNQNNESLSKLTMSPSTVSPSLKRGYTMSEEPAMLTSLPLRPISGDSSSSKKRRFSNFASCTPEHEMAWSSNLTHSQALSTIQFEVDNFSKSLMSQSRGSQQNMGSKADATVDVGVLLPISDKFMILVPQVCRQSIMSNQPMTKSRNSGIKGFLKPQLERSQTVPDPTSIENAIAELKMVDSGLVQLIFACHTRLHFAFSIALDIISSNISNPTITANSYNHPLSSIGSYTLPATSPLSTLLHLHAISHSLERLDATLRRYLSPESAPTAGFFEGIFCKQKRSEMAVHAFKERAFEEASERKNLLMSRIREIVAEVAGNEF